MTVEPRELMIAFIPLITVVAIFCLLAYWIWARSHARQMAHRERLAMIDKGLVPPPEMLAPSLAAGRPSAVAARFRSAGIIFVGLGVGLAFIIGVAFDQPQVGIGIGGAIVAIGAAMIVNAMLSKDEARIGGTTVPRDVDGPGTHQ